MDRNKFDSQDEYFFACWLEELKSAGYVEEWTHHPNKIELTGFNDRVAKPWVKVTKLKTKTKRETREKVLIHTASGEDQILYTPDFEIRWNWNAHGIFFWQEGGHYETLPPIYATHEMISVIEIKGSYDPHNTIEGTRVRMAVAYDRHGILVELKTVAPIFKATFAPLQFFYTPTGKVRKLSKAEQSKKWETIESFSNKC